MLRMVPLTTQQRDVLHLLLTNGSPLVALEIGQRIDMTPRQVHYSLRVVKDWLAHRQIMLRNAPGVGAQVVCTPDQRQQLMVDLAGISRFQLVLNADQRQQLLAFAFLFATQPLTLSQLQEDIAVSRTTVLKDLEEVESWFRLFGLELVRRQHAGSWLEGGELFRRQALAALFWGVTPFGRAIFSMEHSFGLTCSLLPDADLLPVLGRVREFMLNSDIGAAIELVSRAEADLGWHFSDESVLYLALVLCIQQERIAQSQYARFTPSVVGGLRGQAVWLAGEQLVQSQWPALSKQNAVHEVAAVAMQVLACPHEGGASEPSLRQMVASILEQIAQAYRLVDLRQDVALRSGLESHLHAAVLRQRYSLWAPPAAATDLADLVGAFEQNLIEQIVSSVRDELKLELSPSDRHTLLLLLQAAVTRARPAHARHVLVVCPSGMATTQLLVARLRSRFPRLSSYEVVPLRELSMARANAADLIITTIPLALPAPPRVSIIQVHPALTPEDIAALGHWLA